MKMIGNEYLFVVLDMNLRNMWTLLGSNVYLAKLLSIVQLRMFIRLEVVICASFARQKGVKKPKAH